MPDPDLQTILSLSGQLAPQVVRDHLGRLEGDYLDRFDAPTIAEHLKHLCRLAADHPIQVIIRDSSDGVVECTVLAFDHPFEFSLIAGVLAGTGYTIRRGDVFTLKARRGGSRKPSRPLRRRTPRPRDPLRDGVIIDHFSGRLVDPAQTLESWSDRFESMLADILGLVDRGDEASLDKAKHRVNELVTHRLSGLEAVQGTGMLPVQLETDQVQTEAGQRTRLHIVGQDTPAFLYSLSTALSLQGLSIERVRIQTQGNTIEDEVHVVDRQGEPITEPNSLERVKLSVLLTKQFTYFLDRAPDPFTALTRFEQLADGILDLPRGGQWVQTLSDPRTMEGLAKLLGTSDFLWEDFIRVHYESLLPIFTPHLAGHRFCPPPETVPVRLDEALEGARDREERRERLNTFKDREIFLIDLDHILAAGSDFQELSRRLTMLAECLVAAAVSLVYGDLVEAHGAPRCEDGKPARHAVFGLGKLGGVALGYASDIELLFVYEGLGKTGGGRRGIISNVEFFELLTRQTASSIRTKREGIFEVDLRLRPYGVDGPLACSLAQFRSYYGPPVAEDQSATGPGRSHPFEQLALVRLRWISGDPELGFEVENMRNRFLYDKPQLDLDALWDAWNRRHAQKSAAGKLNAKYSCGGLVDLEGTVQLLQVMHAARAPQLRTPRLSNAMESLRRAGILAPREYADLAEGTIFCAA